MRSQPSTLIVSENNNDHNQSHSFQVSIFIYLFIMLSNLLFIYLIVSIKAWQVHQPYPIRCHPIEDFQKTPQGNMRELRCIGCSEITSFYCIDCNHQKLETLISFFCPFQVNQKDLLEGSCQRDGIQYCRCNEVCCYLPLFFIFFYK